MQVNFQQPEPTLSQNETIVKPAIKSQNSYTVSQDLRIPVEDQRLVAVPAKVGYDVPVYNYKYIPVEQQTCTPCCGCEGSLKVSNYTNLYAYGEKERKSPWENPEDQQYDWTDVVKRFERKYGKGTFDISLLNNGRGD